MSREPWNWNKEDLDMLIGQAESIRLDFKQSRLFAESHDHIVDNLSRELSAFANTEGGTIVVGIVERRDGKARVADRFDDGVDIKAWSPERIQQLCESNMSPPLRGLRVRAIPLDEMRTKHAIAIHVPTGSTAYQAHDRCYYGRSEYESKALLDHEIRMLMFRGRVSNAAVSVISCSRTQESHPSRTGSVRSSRAKNLLQSAEYRSEALRQSVFRLGPGDRIEIVRFTFSAVVENLGEKNLTDFRLLLRLVGQHNTEICKDTTIFGEAPAVKVLIFPGQIYPIRSYSLILLPTDSFRELEFRLDWHLFLSNALPVNGQIDLNTEFERAGVIE